MEAGLVRSPHGTSLRDGERHVARARARGLTMEAYSGEQFVGIDLHRRRSVIVRTTEGGEVLETVRTANDIERWDR